jgi:hypothetical protein
MLLTTKFRGIYGKSLSTTYDVIKMDKINERFIAPKTRYAIYKRI